MAAWYNEIDPFAAAWLRELIKAGHIAPGEVDERSIIDVRPDDLRGFTQCHFFAGIGVWSHALRRAGWPDDRPVWTGSCPCQPFSTAGKGSGFDDERHLWPAWHHLIGECRPGVVLGEQVASKDGLGWLDLVQADLEAAGYASGAVDLCAAGVGAPHIRQRLWFVAKRLADADGVRQPGIGGRREDGTPERGEAGGLGDSCDERFQERVRVAGISGGSTGTRAGQAPIGGSIHAGGMADAAEQGRKSRGRLADESNGGGAARIESGRLRDAGRRGAAGGRIVGGLADAAHRSGAHERIGDGPAGQHVGAVDRASGGIGVRDRTAGDRPASPGDERALGLQRGVERPGPVNGIWRDADRLYCRDGKWRPVEPGTFPLAHGAAARVGRLRGYGNAINAEAAVAFIEAYLDIDTIDLDIRRVRLMSRMEDDMGVFG